MEWLKLKNAARYCDVSERSFRGWLKKGLRFSRLPSGSIRIKKSWIDQYLQGFEITENRVDDLVDGIMGEMHD